MTIEQIATTGHEVNKAFCIGLGDFTQLPFRNAPDWQKVSAINAVKFHIANPEAKPSASHECWMKEKLENGWKYGESKDENLKTHHCIVPFNKLPPEQQAKDIIFKAVVDGLRHLL